MDLGVDLRLAEVPSSVEGEAADQYGSLEGGGPDPDGLAEESCDDNREQEGGIAREEEHRFAA